MKILFLFLLTITLAFSSDKKIILGSYVQEINSSNTLNEVQKIIQEDEALQKLIEINQLTVQVEKLGQYHVVSVATLTDYVQLLRTMKAFRKYYADLYALPPYEATVATAAQKEVQPLQAEVAKEVKNDTIQQVEALPAQETQEDAKAVEVAQDVKELEDTIQNESIPEVTPTPEEPTSIKETSENSPLPTFHDAEEPVEERTLFTTQIIVTIAIGVLLLMVLLGILFTMTRSAKEDKNKYN